MHTDFSLYIYIYILYICVGTRYKRRGVNENGHCANYVETEQVSLILTRFEG